MNTRTLTKGFALQKKMTDTTAGIRRYASHLSTQITRNQYYALERRSWHCSLIAGLLLATVYFCHTLKKDFFLLHIIFNQLSYTLDERTNDQTTKQTICIHLTLITKCRSTGRAREIVIAHNKMTNAWSAIAQMANAKYNQKFPREYFLPLPSSPMSLNYHYHPL